MIDLPRIIVAGQVPPPMGGQNAMIEELLANLRETGSAKVEHLSFHFTPDTKAARKGQFAKLIELSRVLLRLFKLRFAGPIDLLVFPPGGPQTVPLIRDLLLLPWTLLLSKRVVLHFHAAGLADSVKKGRLLARFVAWSGSFCEHAIIMSEFNRKDPLCCNISSIKVIPHALKDEYHHNNVLRNSSMIRFLSMGHLCSDKGTPNLIKAVAALCMDYPNIILELAGEPLAPYSFESLKTDISQAGLENHVVLLGIITGNEKRQAFGRADIFVFPSIAPYESFGLVMVEAMMWGIPIVASQWRGNSDILKNSEGSQTFEPANCAKALEGCLRSMLSKKEHWYAMGQVNRSIFLDHYDQKTKKYDLANYLSEIA